jgi:hypothetical protein
MHVAVAFGKVHTVPQLPQSPRDLRSASQPLLATPSQSSKPAAHNGTQTPAVQLVVP